jgi:hypothetical protein
MHSAETLTGGLIDLGITPSKPPSIGSSLSFGLERKSSQS